VEIMSDDDLRKLPAGAIDWLRRLRDGTPRFFSSWCAWCESRGLVTVRLWRHGAVDDLAIGFTPLGRRALELADAMPQAEQPQQPPPLTPEHAAILKVLLATYPETQTIEKIEERVKFNERDICGGLQYLRSMNLVHEPFSKKGSTLTPEGQVIARNLPAAAGVDLMRSPGR
jgi:hypothetical protein